MRKIRNSALMACWVLAGTASWGQQPVPAGRPGVGASLQGPGPVRLGGTDEAFKSLESQRAAFEIYQKCIRDNDRSYRLHSISKQLIDARDNKEKLERFIANNPEMQARFKSYEEELPRAMAAYREAGGTARSIDEITQTPNPCSHMQPGPKPPPPRTDDRDSKSAVAASISIPNPSYVAPSKPSASQGASRNDPPATTRQGTKTSKEAARARADTATKSPARARSNLDARECLKLGSDKAIMACAEKFR